MVISDLGFSHFSRRRAGKRDPRKDCRRQNSHCNNSQTEVKKRNEEAQARSHHSNEKGQ
jgi:hypothetical protein